MNSKLILLLLALFACTVYSFRLKQEIEDDDDNPIHINPGPEPFENKTDPDSPFNPNNNN